jgi:GTP-binding protein
MSERIVAIVGRPNVGKSALFNRLAGEKIAIVHDQPGVTRDRIHATCTLGAAPFTIVDTGGIGGHVDLEFTEQVHVEAEVAIETAHLLLLVVDGQSGLTPVDEALARKLRRAGKPLLLVVNKIDTPRHAVQTADFARLGFADLLAVSAEHGRGIRSLVEVVESRLPAPALADEEASRAEAADRRPLKIAIVGRPNVGKSSLTNAILRDERTLVSPIAGTTRDAVDIPWQVGRKHYVLIDTAGIRHRRKVASSVEVFSVMRSEKSIQRADLCCLVIDAAMGVTAMDKKIAALIQEAGRPCVVAVNKWDLIREKTRGPGQLQAFLEEAQAELVAVSYAPLILCCAKDRIDITRLFKTFEKVRAGARRHLGTGELNRLLQAALTATPPPARRNKRFKLLYATQAEPPPEKILPVPQLVVFCNDPRLLETNYRRYLEARIRAAEPFPGLPIYWRFRGRERRDAGGRA